MAHARIAFRGLIYIQQKYKFVRCSSVVLRLSLHTDTGKEDKPIRYSTSKAASWKASTTRSGEEFHDYPWEENDMDEQLQKSLYDRIAGLEEKQLELTHEYNEQHGHDNTTVIARLNELREENIKL